MEYVLLFITTFILVYLFYYLFVIRKENALKKMKQGKEFKLLSRLGDVKLDSYDIKKVSKAIALANSFIISVMVTFEIVMTIFIENFYLWLIVSSVLALILLVPLIMIVYKITGKKLKKEGSK